MPSRMLASLAAGALVVAVACNGDSSSPTGSGAAGNRPPTVTLVANPPGQPIVGITTMTFSASGGDPDGDPVTYTWDLGEGMSASGSAVSRLYRSEGSFPVAVTAADGRGATTTARMTVAARTLSGTWTPVVNGVRLDPAELTQDGTALYGAVDAGCCKHTFAGEVSHPRSVALLFRFSGCKKRDLPFTGTVSVTLDRIETTGPNCNVPQTRFDFVRP